jgi:hypothetical protein
MEQTSASSISYWFIKTILDLFEKPNAALPNNGSGTKVGEEHRLLAGTIR